MSVSVASLLPGYSEHEDIEQAAIRAVAYADIFDYPLSGVEVHHYLHGVPSTPEATAVALRQCAALGGPLGERDGFYTLPGREGLVELRRDRLTSAQRRWPTAIRWGRVLGGVPFVRMVAVTGSLAWDNVDKAADIDYLIVTEPGRLWLCRWMVTLVTRAARAIGIPLCPNYLISTRALSLSDRNIYTAHELVRMTPIVGFGTYRRLRKLNAWCYDFLPNAPGPSLVPSRRKETMRGWWDRVLTRLARLSEDAFRSEAGALLECWEMRYRIRKRLRQSIDQGDSAYGVDRFKCHTAGYQRRILTIFAQRLRSLGARAR
ncbi:MAG: hypothetical protein HY700_18260 [Gemmatimonadetes bacterium]|nr:hypothetical protein [Gemmatimonadota bacterium]